ncbi:hypothetical protein P152DRAFT_412160 [Eremomyces bilateralis CBS 781.70]|uniref:Serine/threonine-protein kinase Tel1 n=1 Tax=Eremomyces bilateralis CBS 781.70 TaxID=1392243 RepID=A0A6G1GAH0_9PEZI|nr:uncharacterized protein P152DRAFT_412160 [Eremomyces bilateralis CBS 781.70]KAF1815065.1 hypothetical protein P152DRAFT_412160 [Eremomyces bilateralis CBS 781.70]
MKENGASLSDAVKSMQSSVLKNQKEGVAELRQWFSRIRKAQQIEEIKKEEWNDAFNALFELVSSDRSLWLKVSKATSNSAALRLGPIGVALREIIEGGVHCLNTKLLMSILDHIIQTLRVGDDGFCEPLGLDYLKCVRTIFEYQPHVEHLRANQWLKIMDFCLDSCQRLRSIISGASFSLRSNGSNSFLVSPASLEVRGHTPTRGRTPTQEISNRTSQKSDHDKLLELVYCMKLLLMPANAPTLERAEKLAFCLVELLRSFSRGTLDIVTCINSLLLRVAPERHDLTKNLLSELLGAFKQHWSNKTPMLKEQILISLTIGRFHLKSMLRNQMDLPDLESLLASMISDYHYKKPDNHLRLHNVTLHHRQTTHKNLDALSTATFSLRTLNTKQKGSRENAVGMAWAFPYMIAYFMTAIDTSVPSNRRDDNNNEFDGPRKRVRRAPYFEEFLRVASKSSPKEERVLALQVLAFMIHHDALSEIRLAVLVESLTGVISDQNSTVSAWAMVVLAAAIMHPQSKGYGMKETWLKVWQVSFRALPSPLTGRAAAHLLDLMLRTQIVSYVDISGSIEACLNATELSGPSVLSDATLSLWQSILRLKSSENPNTVEQTAVSIISWIFNKWRATTSDDGLASPLSPIRFIAQDIAQALYACSNLTWSPIVPAPLAVLDSVGQVLTETEQAEAVFSYLLLLPRSPKSLDTVPPAKSAQSGGAEPIASQRSFKIDAHLLDLLSHEADRLHDVWSKDSTHTNKAPTGLRLILMFGIFGSTLVSHPNPRLDKQYRSVSAKLSSLFDIIAAQVQTRFCPLEYVDMVVQTIGECLPDAETLTSPVVDTIRPPGISHLCTRLANAFDVRREKLPSVWVEEDAQDFMDWDTEFDSQRSTAKPVKSLLVPARGETAQLFGISSVRSYVSCFAKLFSCAADEPTEDNRVPTSFISYLADIPPDEICSCRLFTRSLFRSSIAVSVKDAEILLQAAGSLLQDYDMERSEAAICFALEVFDGFVEYWADTQNPDLYDLGESIHEWIVSKALKAKIVSANAHSIIARLLFRLMQFQPDMGQKQGLPSVRTSVFSLLDEAEVPIKFQIANQIASMFNLFTLANHEAIFDDIQANLPSDKDHMEGIAMRLLVLCQLGSSWHTLLRRCVYHIFETAAMVDGSDGHATQCLADMSRNLMLESPKELFRLFAPQILFAWMSASHELSEIPHSSFGYNGLCDLLHDVEDEAVAQAYLRAHRPSLELLQACCKRSEKEMLIKNFARSAAYTIAHDTARGLKGPKSMENQLMLVLGKSEYLGMVRESFPQVLGHVLCLVRDESDIRTILAKQKNNERVYGALSEMMEFSHAESVLGMAMQPDFPTQFLMEETDRMCRRGSRDAKRSWSPQTFVVVLRMMLNKLHKSLGPLYFASMLRRIRLAICFAGDSALHGYPLEMTLHALRPFLVNGHCADDAIGIVQYLYVHGAPSLRTNLRFTAGIALTTLIELRQFAVSKQDQTTQESQHNITQTKTKKFIDWYTTYLSALNHGGNQNSDQGHFQSLVRSACDASGVGNAKRGSAESRLLLAVFEDERSGLYMLSEAARNLTLRLFTRNFDPPPRQSDDALGSEELAANYAVQLWKSSKLEGVSVNYLQWCARVLGRAYFLRLGTSRLLQTNFHKRETLKLPATTAIVQKLGSVLYSDNLNEAGVAEWTLRSILNCLWLSATEQEYWQEDFDEEIVKALMDSAHESVMLPPNASLHPRMQSPSLFADRAHDVSTWSCGLALSLVQSTAKTSVLSVMPTALRRIEGLSEELLPSLAYLVLHQQLESRNIAKQLLSEAFAIQFGMDPPSKPILKNLLHILLFLQRQRYPRELTHMDRVRWLDVNYLDASKAASQCGMFTTALMLAELTVKPQPRGRRSSMGVPPAISSELLLEIYRGVDEPDSFYGVQQEPGFSTVIERLDYEEDGLKHLMFRGARLDAHVRDRSHIDQSDGEGAIKALTQMNLLTFAHVLPTAGVFQNQKLNLTDSVLNTARRLEEWNVRAPESTTNESSTLYRVLQGLRNAPNGSFVKQQIDTAFLTTLNALDSLDWDILANGQLRALATLTEIDDLASCKGIEQFSEVQQTMESRNELLKDFKFQDVQAIMSRRETIFSTLRENERLHDHFHMSGQALQKLELDSLLASAKVSRSHHAVQESLSTVAYLNQIARRYNALQLNYQADIEYETALVLWDQGEHQSSIQMLQNLNNGTTARKSQGAASNRPILLARLAFELDEARLEKPDDIIREYLQPAIHGLRPHSQGSAAGQVYNQFATFCDRQLQSGDHAEQMDRIQRIIDRQKAEIQAYRDLMKTPKVEKAKNEYTSKMVAVRRWTDIETRELKRIKDSRENLLVRSLENYLLGLTACDDFDLSVLRFFALWLEFCEMDLANTAVGKHLDKVPSRKFVFLMNQIASRLQTDQSKFQTLLSDLVVRICVDHPFHAMHHIHSGTKLEKIGKSGQPGGADEILLSKINAAKRIAALLKGNKRSSRTWSNIDLSDAAYHEASHPIYGERGEKLQPGRELSLDRFSATKRLIKTVPALGVPPPSFNVLVRSDCDYSSVPVVERYKTTMKIAGGLSTPKIITAVTSDGNTFKELVKGGSDDLRQDAIMEQVFEHVSRLLGDHFNTRRRNLKIRTYKVLPLTPRSGVIEFVKDTISLNDFLAPAHERYYPKDIKASECRKRVHEATGSDPKSRLKAYQDVADRYHPVLRHFFFENYSDPDEWFEKRLAYTRTTAAISILGHVLGLGDRHLQNILLDSKTGEVVHIDLGVAFEAGRVLPIPEVVPFRLTRDIVDAMGYTKTEGVFRRCCEFTLDALREEKGSIMTLLNVLRYDPLYSWTISPLKAKRVQDEEEVEDQVGPLGGVTESSSNKPDEAGEASRALSAVEKKLTKDLSVAATVNELIQQATDAQNLAVLFAGWAPYA